MKYIYIYIYYLQKKKKKKKKKVNMPSVCLLAHKINHVGFGDY